MVGPNVESHADDRLALGDRGGVRIGERRCAALGISHSARATRIDPAGTAPRALPIDLPSLVAAALDLRGVPYRLGGEDPDDGFDCSGFVRYVYALQHVELPRTVAEQALIGTAIPIARVRAGDLIFFSTTSPGASHVGIVIGAAGNDEFVHAPANSGAVRVEHFNGAYWRQRFVAARRLF